MAALRQAHPDKGVELWCEDEGRLGLKPVVRRVWAERGTRPTSCGRHKFESVFVYGFAHPASGRGRFVVLPKANAECMGQALADFARWADPDGTKVLVLIVDGSAGTRRRNWWCRRTSSSTACPVVPPNSSRPNTCGLWCGRDSRTGCSTTCHS